ncbi:phosphotriesterase family protein [Pectinatus frisingensis]|uniref:phosphotriesterase family protein n=1 Tax=Pectinatus frisingensis TaxID=865 RepID=UPI003D807AD6
MSSGITYMHEHITIDLSKGKNDMDCCLDASADTLQELKKIKKAGVANIVDVTNRGMGRNIEYVKKIQEDSGINIIFSTGFYKEPYLPPEVYSFSVRELAEIMISEIMNGIGGTSIRASLIGEIGTGKGEISPIEQKVFEAASIAHAETGCAISTHTTLGTLGLEQVKLLKSNGVDPGRVIIGHVDLSQDIDYILRLIDQGVYVAFDTVGKINYVPDEKRADMLAVLIERGLAEKIVLSMDITRKSHLKNRGGLGYGYLIENFIPLLLKHGISRRDCHTMLVDNPARLLKNGGGIA